MTVLFLVMSLSVIAVMGVILLLVGMDVLIVMVVMCGILAMRVLRVLRVLNRVLLRLFWFFGLLKLAHVFRLML